MNRIVPHRRTFRLSSLFTAAVLAASPSVFGQAAQPSGTGSGAIGSPIKHDDDTILMSPFTVTSEDDTGYLATSTLAGTRLRTDLRDVGSAISVVTSQFLQDTATRNVEDLLVYTTNTEIGGVRGNMSGITVNAGGSTDETGTFTRQNTNNRVRGLGGADNTRDYFVSDIPWDSYNVGRVDMQRGPNSILFGLGNPAGVVNAGLNQAAFKNSRRLENRIDQFGSIRMSFDLNQVLLPQQLAVRFAILRDETQYQQRPAFNDDKRVYGALRYDPAFLARKGLKTSLRVDFEHGNIDAMRPRTLPPIDRLSPWFRTTPYVAAANPLIGKPEVTYMPINRSVYNNWDMVNSRAGNPATNFAAEGGHQWYNPTSPNSYSKRYPANSGWLLNPYYQPFISEVYTSGVMGFYEGNGSTVVPNAQYATSGTTLQYGWNTNTGPKVKATPLGVAPAGGVGSFRYSQWQTIAEPWKSYGYMDIPFGGSWRDPSLTDTGVFDFFKQNLDGDNRRSWRNFDAVSAAIDETALDNRLGLNLAIDHQEYGDGSHSIFNDRTQTITVDVNATFPASNLPNPNAGRAMMLGDGNYNTRRTFRDELRATGFAELRSRDLFHKGLISDILGRHILTGLLSRNTYDREDRGYRRFMLDPNDLADPNDPLNTEIASDIGVSNGATAYRTQIYLTPQSMQDTTLYPSMSSLHLQPPSGIIAPKMVNLTYFDSHWNRPLDPSAPGYVNPNANTFLDPYSNTLSAQRNNPANYVGWVTKPVHLLDATRPADRDRMITSDNMSRMRIASKAFVWQGFLFNGNLVPTFGYREDTAKSYQFQSGSAGIAGMSGIYRPQDITVTPPGASPTVYLANPGGVRTPDGFVIPNSSNLHLPDTPNATLSTINRSWSIVGHSPRFIRQYLPWGTSLSLSYNESSNFNPNEAGRVNMWNQTIAPSEGKTRDIGLLVSTLENRINFRIVKYRSAIKGASASGFSFSQLKEIEGRAWVAAKKMEDAIKAEQTKDYLGNPIPGKAAYTSEFDNPGYLYGTIDPGDQNRILYASQAEKDALLARGLAMVNTIFKNTPTDLFKAWNVPLTTDDWRNTTDVGTLPANATTVQDTVAEGWEYEMTLQPTRNWRITGNMSTTKSVRDNTFSDIKDFILARNEIWNGPQGDFYYSSPGRERSAFRDDWNSRLMPTFTTGLLGNGMVVQEGVRRRWNIVTSYDFSRWWLKGLTLGGAYRWEDRAAIGYKYKIFNMNYSSGGQSKTVQFQVPDLNAPIYGPEQNNVDLWIGYAYKLAHGVRWHVQLNVRNVGGRNELVPISTQPDGTLAQFRIKEGQSWSLTNTFDF